MIRFRKIVLKSHDVNNIIKYKKTKEKVAKEKFENKLKVFFYYPKLYFSCFLVHSQHDVISPLPAKAEGDYSFRFRPSH